MTTISDRLATALAATLVALIALVAILLGAEPDMSMQVGDPCPGSDSAGYVLTKINEDGSFRCDFVSRNGETSRVAHRTGMRFNPDAALDNSRVHNR